ncbi:hypothetical protein JW766_05850 [Candidatus Dojkabacteria bacterium]|nr:hypothetical protein [Candidatus Dojkabacteria bacterium]
MKALFYLLIPITAIVNTVGQVFLKLGAGDITLSGGILNIIKSGWKLIVGLFFFGLTFILSTVISKKLDITFVYPLMTGLTFLMLSVVMVVFLKREPMSILKGVGMFVIISGILLMSLAQKMAK